ncbi:MAG: IS1634 family transposase [Limnochordia bacterium]|jgi:transposase
MDRIKELGLDVRTFFNAKPAFIAGVLDAMQVPEFFDQAIGATKQTGRPPKISDGTIAKLMLINICDNHHPLYRLQEYFLDKDIQLLAGEHAELDLLHDDRFGDLLDRMFEAGPRAIFSAIATSAFLQYGLSIRSLNYDTTSKVMWGEYEGDDGRIGTISITLGHSKDKRGDKNQLKIGLGTADGVIVDAKVLSGNTDDKTYNNDALDDADVLLERHGVDRESFYYVADSAFFTEANIEKAKDHGIKFITRAPESVTVTNQLIDQAWEHPGSFLKLQLKNNQGQLSEYMVQEFDDAYRETACKFAVCYSPSLEKEKQKTMTRRIAKEKAELDKLAKQYAKRNYACQPNAEKEIAVFTTKRLPKVQYHRVDFQIVEEEKRGRGRPKKNQPDDEKNYIYRLLLSIELDEAGAAQKSKRNATFVLASNDLDLSAEQILAEYKTQSSVEKKFQQLKSPHFVNSLYLKKPERIEALVYIILIAMMVLSVVERVVRREMETENAVVIGPGKVKMTRPTLRAIVDIFGYAPINRYSYEGQVSRALLEPLNDSQAKILRYLGIPTNIFTET